MRGGNNAFAMQKQRQMRAPLDYVCPKLDVPEDGRLRRVVTGHAGIHVLIGFQPDTNQMPKILIRTPEPRQPRAGETEKMAVNMGVDPYNFVYRLSRPG